MKYSKQIFYAILISCVMLSLLKLAGIINWSWFWTLFPLTIPLLVITLMIVIALLFSYLDDTWIPPK